MKYYEGFNEISYKIGMIEAFCEMVNKGVKKLALSSPLTQENYKIIENVSKVICEKYNVKSYLEKELMSTDLAPDEYVKDQYVILYYENDDVINKYIELKSQVDKLKANNLYNDDEKKKISIEFRRLLDYPDHKIKELYNL